MLANCYMSKIEYAKNLVIIFNPFDTWVTYGVTQKVSHYQESSLNSVLTINVTKATFSPILITKCAQEY